eukprot:scaffold24191_cov69-Phaeocystis_antarctica.AAC.8
MRQMAGLRISTTSITASGHAAGFKISAIMKQRIAMQPSTVVQIMKTTPWTTASLRSCRRFKVSATSLRTNLLNASRSAAYPSSVRTNSLNVSSAAM